MNKMKSLMKITKSNKKKQMNEFLFIYKQELLQKLKLVFTIIIKINSQSYHYNLSKKQNIQLIRKI